MTPSSMKTRNLLRESIQPRLSETPCWVCSIQCAGAQLSPVVDPLVPSRTRDLTNSSKTPGFSVGQRMSMSAEGEPPDRRADFHATDGNSSLGDIERLCVCVYLWQAYEWKCPDADGFNAKGRSITFNGGSWVRSPDRAPLRPRKRTVHQANKFKTIASLQRRVQADSTCQSLLLLTVACHVKATVKRVEFTSADSAHLMFIARHHGC